MMTIDVEKEIKLKHTFWSRLDWHLLSFGVISKGLMS